MKRGFLFLRNFHSSTLPNPEDYDELYYDECILFPTRNLTYPVPIPPSEPRIAIVRRAINAIAEHLNRTIKPLDLSNPQALIADQIDCIVVKVPLMESFEGGSLEKYVRVEIIREDLHLAINHKTFTGFYEQVGGRSWHKVPSLTSLERTVEDHLEHFIRVKLRGYASRRGRACKSAESGLSPWVSLGVMPVLNLLHLVEKLPLSVQTDDSREFRRQVYWALYCRYRCNQSDWAGAEARWPLRGLTPSQSDMLHNWMVGALPEGLKPWVQGLSGGTVVEKYLNDGMKHMLKTGVASNRFRLMTSYYLSYILGIPWGYGEIYFREVLLDYHPNLNRYNWYAQCVRNRFLKSYNLGTQYRNRLD